MMIATRNTLRLREGKRNVLIRSKLASEGPIELIRESPMSGPQGTNLFLDSDTVFVDIVVCSSYVPTIRITSLKPDPSDVVIRVSGSFRSWEGSVRTGACGELKLGKGYFKLVETGAGSVILDDSDASINRLAAPYAEKIETSDKAWLSYAPGTIHAPNADCVIGTSVWNADGSSSAYLNVRSLHVPSSSTLRYSRRRYVVDDIKKVIVSSFHIHPRDDFQWSVAPGGYGRTSLYAPQHSEIEYRPWPEDRISGFNGKDLGLVELSFLGMAHGYPVLFQDACVDIPSCVLLVQHSKESSPNSADIVEGVRTVLRAALPTQTWMQLDTLTKDKK